MPEKYHEDYAVTSNIFYTKLAIIQQAVPKPSLSNQWTTANGTLVIPR